MLRPETEEQTTSAQAKMENLFVERGITKSNRPFQNKISSSLGGPLENEPKVKVNIPKPEPRGQNQDPTGYECALDGLKVLDKHQKSTTFGRIYGKHFRYFTAMP